MLLSFQQTLSSRLGFVKLTRCFFNFLWNEGSRLVQCTAMTLLLLSNALNIDNTRNRVLSSIYSSVVSRSSSEPMRLFQSMETIVPIVQTTTQRKRMTKAFDEGVDTLRKSVLLVLSPVVHLWKAPRVFSMPFPASSGCAIGDIIARWPRRRTFIFRYFPHIFPKSLAASGLVSLAVGDSKQPRSNNSCLVLFGFPTRSSALTSFCSVLT